MFYQIQTDSDSPIIHVKACFRVRSGGVDTDTTKVDTGAVDVDPGAIDTNHCGRPH